MKRDDIFPSKYLKAADLKGKPRVVEIEKAPAETFRGLDGSEQTKTVLYFRGLKKALPLNLTNWDAVADICGDDTVDWPGNKIELYPTQTEMKGKMVDCIRIRAPQQGTVPTKSAPPAAKPTAPSRDDMDDEIPW